MTASHRILDLHNARGDHAWLEPFPSVVREQLDGRAPLAHFRAVGAPGKNTGGRAMIIDPGQARLIAAALIAFADKADRAAAGR